jgi:hypothetical protein
VPEGTWSDAVAVRFTWSVACTGTLIAPDLVLTAGHCAGDIVSVIVGTNDYERGGEAIEVAETHEHPDSWNTYDVAVLVLDHAATVPPRTIARDCVLPYLEDGADVTIVGFGATDEDATEYSSELMQAFTTIGDADCSDLERDCNPAVSPGGELVAGGDGVDSCTGDSGGPLYLRTPKGDYLVGVTSRAAQPSDVPCGDGGIYARADAVVPWIEQTTGRVLERPWCGEDWNLAPEPTSTAIDISQGGAGASRITPNDPNPDQAFVFQIVEQPIGGRGAVDADGLATYQGDPDFSGEDDFVVAVTDDGSPPLSGQVRVPVTVTATRDDITLTPVGCGCGGRQRGSVGLLLAALVVTRRRHA